ncbi:MAG: methionyl-tRNA formyltransferase [Candidatus Promineifilaceae bacterium]
MAKIVFMGTPDFAVPILKTLIKTQTVVGVVTQPDRPAGRGRRLQPPPVKEVAEAADILVYQPRSLRKEEAADPIRAWEPEMIVVAAFGQILRPHLLELPSKGCLNVHASLLPRWRGASPIHHAILSGDGETGITLMRMDEGLDTGPMYVQEAIPIRPNETAESLHDRLAQLGAKMIREHLDRILSGGITAVPQPEDGSTYAPMIKKEEGQIDWQRSAAEIDRLIRAMTPWPGAFTTWNGQNLKVLAARPQLTGSSGDPGLVVAEGDGAAVITGDGRLALESVQLAGKTPTLVDDFLRGHPDFVGSRLG